MVDLGQDTAFVTFTRTVEAVSKLKSRLLTQLGKTLLKATVKLESFDWTGLDIYIRL